MTNTLNRKYLDVGDETKLDVFEFVGTMPGPLVCIIGGIHGDEEEGVLSVKRFINMLKDKPLVGRVLCLPIANPGAYAACQRVNPADKKDLARVFPGNKNGSITDRIAAVITEELISGADVMIDLHSAGKSCAMPLFCGFFELGNSYSEKCAKYAAAFGTEIVWAHTQTSEGRSLSAALALDVPAIYAECGGGGEVHASDSDAYVDGLLNILKSLNMVDGEKIEPSQRTLITDDAGNTDQAIMAPNSGIIVNHVAARDILKKGDIISEMYDHDGNVLETVCAPIDGILMLLRRTAHTKKGEAIAMLAPEGVPWVP